MAEREIERPAARVARGLALGLALVLPVLYGTFTQHGPALADEFIYLAGARHLAETGSLDARFYDAHALLRQAYPHQDNHSPGYVILLGTLTKLVRGSYWTAVALNALGYLASLLFIYVVARRLGRTVAESYLAVALLAALPAFVPYLFWAMAEASVLTLFLAALATAAQARGTVGGSMLTGLVWGLGFLVRESALFGLPAVLALLGRKRAVIACLATALTFGVLVYAPLSKNRSQGASNFWAPTSGKEFGFQVVQSAREGNLIAVTQLAFARAAMNLDELRSSTTPWTERGILAFFFLLPAYALADWRRHNADERRFLLALVLGWSAILAVMVAVYVIARWAGFRYLLFMAPAFLPFLSRSRSDAGPLWRRFAPALLAIAASVALNVSVFGILTSYKVSRQKRQAGIVAYLERYVDGRSLSRIALPSGWLFGLKHYPVEVISSVPQEGGELRLLEQKIPFDYLVLPGASPLREEWDARLKYRRVNSDDPEPPLLVYKRLK